MRSRERHAGSFLLNRPDDWPPDEAEEVFLFRALSQLGVLTGDEGQQALDRTFLWQLQRGELAAIVLDSEGQSHALEARRWKGESRVSIFQTGRAHVTTGTIRGTFPFRQEGYVYISRAELLRFQGGERPSNIGTAPASSNPTWHPLPGQTIDAWANSAIANAEAALRIKAAGSGYNERRIADALAAMSRDAGHDYSSESIIRMRRRAKSRK